MTTLIPGPGGLTESTVFADRDKKNTAHVQQRQTDLKKMLIARFLRQYGNDPVRTSLIEMEVNRCVKGAMKKDDLASLERSVQQVNSPCPRQDGDAPTTRVCTRTGPERPLRRRMGCGFRAGVGVTPTAPNLTVLFPWVLCRPFLWRRAATPCE